MNTSVNIQYDAIDNLIVTEGLQIDELAFYPDQDIMLIILNTNVVLNHTLSSCSLLKKAEKSQLQRYKIIGGGTGVHWPELDEDLSLKGFLQSELRKVVKSHKGSVGT